MMFYEFSEHELLMSKLLSNIKNLQLDYLTEDTEKKCLFCDSIKLMLII